MLSIHITHTHTHSHYTHTYTLHTHTHTQIHNVHIKLVKQFTFIKIKYKYSTINSGKNTLKSFFYQRIFGSGALPDKMLLARTIECNKIDAFLGQIRLSKVQLYPSGLRKEFGQRVRSSCRDCKQEKHTLNLFSTILDPAFYREVHLIRTLRYDSQLKIKLIVAMYT